MARPLTPGVVPRVVLVCGPAGSGKSTHAFALEREGYIRLSFDEIAWALGHRNHPLAAPIARTVHYELAARLLSHVRYGRDVVVDTSFWSRASRDGYRAMLAPEDVVPVVHFLATPKNEILRRLNERAGSGPHDVAVPANRALAYLAGFEVPTPQEGPLIVLGDH